MSCAYKVNRYIVQPTFNKFNVVDTFNCNSSCFLYGFENSEVAASVAREMNKAFNDRPVPANSIGLPFDRWISLLQSGDTAQVIPEMRTAQTLMQKMLAVMDGEKV